MSSSVVLSEISYFSASIFCVRATANIPQVENIGSG